MADSPDKIRIGNAELELRISGREIRDSINEWVDQLDGEVDENTLILWNAEGARPFATQFLIHLQNRTGRDFSPQVRRIAVKGTSGEQQLGETLVEQWLQSGTVSGKRIILLEGLVDTGLRLIYIENRLKQEGATDVLTAVVLNKKGVRPPGGYEPRVSLFSSRNFWAVGFGMDLGNEGQSGRNLDGIYEKVN